MHVAALIPTRGDRGALLEQCLRMMNAQTRRPDHIEIVDDPPMSSEKDITYRYRTGYDRLRGKGFDVILFIEDDDYYSPRYIETMLAKWEEYGRPQMLGTQYTIYYHIRLFAWHMMSHHTRSSAMSTLIKPDMDFEWCADNEPYADMWLWNIHKWRTKIFKPEQHICLGIKGHELGEMTGGFCHTNKLHRYVNQDKDMAFLRSVCDPESFEFYSNYHKAELWK